MRKNIALIVAFITILAAFSACGGESYADKLKKEQNAISRFIDEQGIKVVSTFPETFEKNVYYKDPNTGVYIHVVDPGTGDKPISGKTDVYLRFDKIQNLINVSDSIPSNNSSYYMQFTYGDTKTYMDASNTSSLTYHAMSPSCILPLDLGLGNNAIVNLIVPSSAGSGYQQNTIVPLYYNRLRYRFINDVNEN